MKTLLIALLVTTSAFAAVDENIKCFSQFRSVVKAKKDHVKATDAVTDYGIYSANFVEGIALELMAQSDRRVGSYGYYLKNDAATLKSGFTNLNTTAKTKEAAVDEAFLQLENCILGIEETEVQPEQI